MNCGLRRLTHHPVYGSPIIPVFQAAWDGELPETVASRRTLATRCSELATHHLLFASGAAMRNFADDVRRFPSLPPRESPPAHDAGAGARSRPRGRLSATHRRRHPENPYATFARTHHGKPRNHVPRGLRARKDYRRRASDGDARLRVSPRAALPGDPARYQRGSGEALVSALRRVVRLRARLAREHGSENRSRLPFGTHRLRRLFLPWPDERADHREHQRPEDDCKRPADRDVVEPFDQHLHADERENDREA